MRRLPHLAAALALAACGPTASAPAPQEPDAAAETPAATDRVAIPASVRRNLGVTFATVEARRVERTLRIPGAFELLPTARREYTVALPGTVDLLVEQYEHVEVGQALFRYRSPSWPELLHEVLLGEQAADTARAEITVARAELAEARRRLELARERLDALAEAEFRRADLEVEAAELEASVPRLEAQLALAETRLENARGTREHALHRAAEAAGLTEAELEAEVDVGGRTLPRYRTLDVLEVRAASAGVVERLGASDGAFVEAATSVLAVVDPERLRFRAHALQADLPELAAATEARVVPPRSSDFAAAEALSADLTLGLEAHPSERTVAVLGAPRALAPWARPGVSAFLEVVLEGGGAPELAVPTSSVVQDGLERVLFRRDPADPDVALRVPADVGPSDGRWVVLRSGVMRGDQVVLDGAYELLLATQRSGAPTRGGHVHADGSTHDDH